MKFKPGKPVTEELNIKTLSNKYAIPWLQLMYF